MTDRPLLAWAPGPGWHSHLSPVTPTSGAAVQLRPLVFDRARIGDGFWATRQRTNGTTSIPRGLERLEAAGAIENLRAAARGSGEFRGEMNQDAEVYKWIEAASYEVERSGSHALTESVREIVQIVGMAQESDGYLHTWHQLTREPHYSGLRIGGADETYTAGLLLHAAVAFCRATGDDTLIGVARRVVGCIRTQLFARDPGAVPGHPGFEMALVELFRLTGEREHLELARHLVDQRGRCWLGDHRFGSSHYQDYLPIADMVTLTGHAVAGLYLACGATDVAIEMSDAPLLAALEHQWEAVALHKTYITGGVGSRHKNEDLGDDYELPPDRAYCETCAAVASAMWSWRLLLATGRSRYADAIERVLFNGLLSGVSLDGQRYFYANPLQVRSSHHPPADLRAAERRDWFDLACCPPNLMRLLASLEHYVATTRGPDLCIHQYVSGDVPWPSGGSTSGHLRMATDYPWDGTVTMVYTGDLLRARALSIRVPPWATQASIIVDGERHPVDAGADVVLRRDWRDDDEITLLLGMSPRLTRPHPRVDASRGCVAIEAGPLVYCLEQADQTCPVDDLRVSLPGRLSIGLHDPQLDVRRVVVEGRYVHLSDWEGALYRDVSIDDGSTSSIAMLNAIPYFAWANRGSAAMRVWIPVTTP